MRCGGVCGRRQPTPPAFSQQYRHGRYAPFPDLPRLRRHHAGGPARGRRHDSLVARALRQSGVAQSRMGLGGGRGGGAGTRPCGRPDRRRPARDRLDLRRHRIEQPRDQGRGPLLQGQGQAPDHGEDRAQGGARHHARARAPGLRGDLHGRAGKRPARPREVQGRDPPRHHPRERDVREQRDRRDPGHRGARQAVPRAWRDLPRRRGAGHRQDRDRCHEAAGRPDEPGLAQDLRPQGHRRAVRAAQAARAARSADARRRPRARHAFGHAAHAPDRRHGRGLPPRQARDEGRHRQGCRSCRSSCSTA